MAGSTRSICSAGTQKLLSLLITCQLSAWRAIHLQHLWSISTQRFLRVIRKWFLCPYLQFYVNAHETNTEACCYGAWGSKIFINAILRNGKLNSWQMTQSRHTCNLSIIIKPTITTSIKSVCNPFLTEHFLLHINLFVRVYLQTIISLTLSVAQK